MKVKVRVYGRVQGVGFRYFVKRISDSYQLMGWVKNLDDGSVEALFVGKRAAVESAIEMCRRGPRAAEVESIETIPHDESELPNDFRILY